MNCKRSIRIFVFIWPDCQEEHRSQSRKQIWERVPFYNHSRVSFYSTNFLPISFNHGSFERAKYLAFFLMFHWVWHMKLLNLQWWRISINMSTIKLLSIFLDKLCVDYFLKSCFFLNSCYMLRTCASVLWWLLLH